MHEIIFIHLEEQSDQLQSFSDGNQGGSVTLALQGLQQHLLLILGQGFVGSQCQGS